MTNKVEHRLLSRGIQPTAMRQLVLEFLMNQDHATSLTDLEQGMGHMDRITLYRTLKTFESKGIIHGIDNGTGATKYAICSEACEPIRHRDLHLHFHCENCGETMCLDAVSIQDPDLPDGYILRELNLIAKGICAICNAK